MKSSARISIIAAAVLLLGAGGFGLWWTQSQSGDAAESQKPKPDRSTATAGEKVDSAPETAEKTDTTDTGKDFRFERLADGRSRVTESVEMANMLHSKDAEPVADLAAIDSIFGLYRWAYKENPEGGDNRELVSALKGENPRKLIFLPADHPSLSADGELLDRWGTPYFFHKISDQVIDVTSAGPDKRLWSGDDLTLGYTEAYQTSSSQ